MQIETNDVSIKTEIESRPRLPHHIHATNTALARLEAGLADGTAMMATIEAKVSRTCVIAEHAWHQTAHALCSLPRKQIASGHVIEGLMAFAQGVRMTQSSPLTPAQTAHFAWG